MAWDDTFVFKATKITSTQLNALITHIKTLITGTAGTTTNAIVRANGSTGLVIQGSAATIDDNGTITIPAGQAYNIGTDAITLNDLSDVTMTSPVKGDLIKHDGTDFKKLEKGTAGHYLKINALGTDLEYAAGAAGSGDVAHDTIWTTKGDLAVATTTNAASVLPVGTSIDQVLTPNPDEAMGLKWVSVRPPLGKDAAGLTISQDNGGVERYFFKDDFSNDTIADYVVTLVSSATATVTGGVLTLYREATVRKVLPTISGLGCSWDMVVRFETPLVATTQAMFLYFGGYVAYIQRTTDTSIRMRISGVIADTDTGVDLADNVWMRVTFTYDGTQYRMYCNGTQVGAAGTATAPTTGTFSIKNDSSPSMTNSANEVTFSPSVAFTDPFTSDTETRYMQLSSTDITQPASTGTWAASAAGDVVIGSGYMTVASDNDEAEAVVLRSYNFASGEIEFSLDVNNADVNQIEHTGLLFCYQDILNHYKLVIIDDQAGTETLQFYKVVAGVATALGSAGAIAAYTRGNKTWIKVHHDVQRGQMWAYLRDDAGVYPTIPDVSDAFSSQFSYGKVGFWSSVAAVGAGNISVRFDDLTIRANLLIGETNIPATETGFYLRDEFTVDSIGRYPDVYTSGGTWTVASNKLLYTGVVATKYYTKKISNVQLSNTNIDVSFKFAGDSANGDPTLGFCVLWDGTIGNSGSYYQAANCYRIEIFNIGASGVVQFIRSNSTGDGTTLIPHVDRQITSGTEYTVRLTCVSGLFTLYWEGVSIGTVTDTTFTSGYIGFSGYKQHASAAIYIDDLAISGTRYYKRPMLRGAQIGAYLSP